MTETTNPEEESSRRLEGERNAIASSVLHEQPRTASSPRSIPCSVNSKQRFAYFDEDIAPASSVSYQISTASRRNNTSTQTVSGRKVSPPVNGNQLIGLLDTSTMALSPTSYKKPSPKFKHHGSTTSDFTPRSVPHTVRSQTLATFDSSLREPAVKSDQVFAMSSQVSADGIHKAADPSARNSEGSLSETSETEPRKCVSSRRVDFSKSCSSKREHISVNKSIDLSTGAASNPRIPIEGHEFPSRATEDQDISILKDGFAKLVIKSPLAIRVRPNGQTQESSRSYGGQASSSSQATVRGLIAGSGGFKGNKLLQGPDQDDDEPEPPNDSRIAPDNEHHLQQPAVKYACIFFKADPYRYRECHDKEIPCGGLVQHIHRVHPERITYLLQCCKRTVISKKDADQHDRSKQCTYKGENKLDRCSQAQPAIEKKSRHTTEKEHWYKIFLVFFPDHPRPESPLLGRSRTFTEHELEAFLSHCFDKLELRNAVDRLQTCTDDQIPNDPNYKCFADILRNCAQKLHGFAQRPLTPQTMNSYSSSAASLSSVSSEKFQRNLELFSPDDMDTDSPLSPAYEACTHISERTPVMDELQPGQNEQEDANHNNLEDDTDTMSYSACFSDASEWDNGEWMRLN